MLRMEELQLSKREIEWQEIEDLIICYQKQFEESATANDKCNSQDAAEDLLIRFEPLFKKYLSLLKSGQINFMDPESRLFVNSFIDEYALQAALKKTKQKFGTKNEITKKFKFIVETYGNLPEEDIQMDLKMIFLIIAKRYKQMNRTFCGYLYNAYRHEVSRHIKKYIKNPANIPYRMLEFEEGINGEIDEWYEDNYYESTSGIPDMTWISGEDCSEMFSVLSPLERKIICKYYLEEWNDRQMSDLFGMHINTINQKRRQAIGKIADHMGIEKEFLKRNRRSGKKAILPMGQI